MSAATATAIETSQREFGFTREDFERVRRLIHAHAGIALASSKAHMVYSRLSRRLRVLGLSTFSGYLDRLEHGDDAAEWQAFVNSLTTNLTSFFREAHHFTELSKLLLRRKPGERIVLWCAAASTGEEPYSLAITAAETFGTLTPPVTILATDIDTQVLATAERGIYPLERIADLSAERKRKFFLKGVGANSEQCRVVDALRQMVTFRELNLLDAQYPMRGPFTAIFCRNVMIYFDKPTQHSVLQRMVPLLARDGRFFAGHSESFFQSADLVLPCGQTVYRRTDGVDD